jgi:hypothetical protein
MEGPMMFLRYIRVLDLSRIILLKTNMNEPYLLHFKYLSGLKMTRSDCIWTFVHSSTNDKNEPFSAISWRWQAKFDYDDARFVLDQHIEFEFFSHSSLKQCAGRLVPPLGHIILTPSQPVMQYPSSLVLCVKRGSIAIQFLFILKAFVLYGGVESFWIWMKDSLRWRDTVSGMARFGVCVSQSLVFCVEFCRSLFVLL